MFVRKDAGVLTELEIKEIKSLERKLKGAQKSYDERIELFNNGKYFKTETPSDLDLMFYENAKQRDAEWIANIQNRILEIKSK
jgi:hypothetical protein